LTKLIFLLVSAFVLGLATYREYEAFSVSATDYKVPSSDMDDWLAGDWYVADVAGSAVDTEIGKEAAADLVGQTAHVHDHEFVFDDLQCATQFNQSEEHIVEFYKSYGATPFMLRVHIPATRIDAGCADVFPFARDRAFIAWEGYFLEAVRQPRLVTVAPVVPYVRRVPSVRSVRKRTPPHASSIVNSNAQSF
jgi:hypothetical protein